MTNESLIQVPPNVADPIVLQRFLLRLVEELDILLGKRASSSDAQYVAQKELLSAADALTDALDVARAELEKATSILRQDVENAVEEIDRTNNLQSELLAIIRDFAWFRSFTVGFPGRDTDGPVTPRLAYNVESVTRNGIGVYDVVIEEVKDTEGDSLLERTQQTTSFSIADSAASADYSVQFEITSLVNGTFTIRVYSVQQGAGNKLEYVPYDPLPTDNVNVMGMYTPYDAVIPVVSE